MYSVECDLKPTEDPAKLIKDLMNFFPDASFKASDSKLVGSSSLERFRELAEKQQSVVPLQVLEENGEVFLDKLAMNAGKIALDENSPLGCVTVKE